jgi:hypothetical protein
MIMTSDDTLAARMMHEAVMISSWSRSFVPARTLLPATDRPFTNETSTRVHHHERAVSTSEVRDCLGDRQNPDPAGTFGQMTLALRVLPEGFATSFCEEGEC